MIRPSPFMLKIAGGVLGAGTLAGVAYFKMFENPRAELASKLAAEETQVSELKRKLEERAQVDRKLREFGSFTLGHKEDQVVDSFRNGLAKIAEDCGLRAVSINTNAPKPVSNPLERSPKAPTTLKRELRKQPDFSVIGGTIEGVGSLEQVLKTLATVQSQPWVHRIGGFSMAVEGKERDKLKLRMEVSTLLLPSDLAPKKEGDVTPVPASVASESVWRSIAAKNPFRDPPAAPNSAKPTAVAQNPAPQPPAPPAPAPYADWKLTSVVSGRGGVEAWLINTKTNERQILKVGGRLIDAIFSEGAGERAVFEIGGQKFEVLNGQTFASRRPVQ